MQNQEEPIFDPSRLKKKGKKKKMETKALKSENEDMVDAIREILPEGNSSNASSKKQLYTYDEMLHRLYAQANGLKIDGMKGNELVHPEHLLRTKQKEKFPMPHVENEGFGRGRKTSYNNFRATVQMMHRQERHVFLYFDQEIPCKKSVSDSGVLIMFGNYNQTHMLNIMKRYLVEFVECKICGSRETILILEQGLQRVSCHACQGKKTVQKLTEKKGKN